jgi:hypothetical protein
VTRHYCKNEALFQTVKESEKGKSGPFFLRAVTFAALTKLDKIICGLQGKL